MNKLLIASLLALTCATAQAQPWMPRNTDSAVKLSDVIENYKKHPGLHLEDDDDRRDAKKENGKVIKESKDYLFQRWVWQWNQHLDENGYMVPPIVNWNEWRKYQETHQSGSASKTTATPANWLFEGPDSTDGGYSGLGRVNVVALHPNNPNVFFAGSAGGGAWKTTDGGHTWASLYSNLPTAGVSAIVINPLNPNTMYICTGDADGNDNYSMGVIKSTNGGATWSNTGLIWSATNYMWARSLIMNPRDTNMLILATSSAIQITRNGGNTWTSVRSGNFEQVLFHPTDTTIVYATDYGSSSSQIQRSTNGGVTWSTVTSFSGIGRINLAVSLASPNKVMALAADNSSSGLVGVYRSTNSGASFTPVFLNNSGSCDNNLLGFELGLPTTQCNGQGWYDLSIAVDPSNANNVIIGGINNYYSQDGGVTWQLATTWYGGVPGVPTIHADKHTLVYSPIDGTLFQGCDGGLYKTSNPLTGPWTNITNGMGITEFYRGAVANGVPWAIGGAQDNGTKMMNNGIYSDLTGGDGMQCQIDYNNPTTTWYTASQNGNIDKTTDGGATYQNISSAIPTSSTGIWLTPYILHPTNSSTLLAGIESVYTSPDQGATWFAMSPQFSTSSNVNFIAMSPANANYVYACVEDNTLHFTPDFGVTWNTIPTAIFTNNISRIAVEPKNANILWATFSGYGGTRVASYNHLTNTWTAHSGTLPNVPVNCIVIDSFSKTKYIGTDVAVFYMDTTMTDWALYNTNLPSVQVTDLNINYTHNELWAATFGRGMWKTVKKEIANEISIIPYAADVISVAPNPNRGSFAIHTNDRQLISNKVVARMISVDGRTLYQEELSFDNSGLLKINGNGLPAGNYICEVRNSRMTARCKIVVY